jgi:endogenous inhibitor of DNA gyrase (YacG/DUF329 family)
MQRLDMPCPECGQRALQMDSHNEYKQGKWKSKEVVYCTSCQKEVERKTITIEEEDPDLSFDFPDYL